MGRNLVKKIREDLMMSKTELAKKAKVSPITIGRIENGMPCRLETMRKIINGLGKTLSDKDKIFPNDQSEMDYRDLEFKNQKQCLLKPKYTGKNPFQTSKILIDSS